jgi:hypothetical protein
MVPLTALWLPIVLSAAAVFVASSIIHMALGYHGSDYGKLPEEEKLLAEMRGAGVDRGTYAFPYAPSMKEMGSPEMKAKYGAGPVGLLTVLPSGPPAIGKHLAQWFGFSLLIGVFTAYVAGRALDIGTDSIQVFRIVATIAFMTYGFGEISDSIWKGQPWRNTSKSLLDAMIYGLATGAVFAWLWPM